MSNDDPSKNGASAVRLGYTIAYVDDVGTTVGFYAAAFGFGVGLLTPEGDYGELDTGSTTLAFAAASLAQDNLASGGGCAEFSSISAPPPVAITLLTDDVHGAVAAAVANGARAYVDPATKPWGQLVAYVLDPNGLLLELATPVAG